MQYANVKAKLKQLLSEQNLTYAQLGQSLKMTESGVKKLLGAKDVSLERLSQICTVLNFPLHELLDPGLLQEQTQSVSLSEKAQEYFLKNKSCFFFLLLLYTEPGTMAEILKQYNIPKTRAYQYLRALESLKLLKWLPGDKVNINKNVPALFKYEGKFMKAIVREWAEELLDEALKVGSFKEYEMSTEQIFHLTKKSAVEFKESMSELISEFARRSAREKRHANGRLVPVRVLTILLEGHFVKKV